MSADNPFKIILKPKRDKNLRAHHPWIFSGAIQKVQGKPQSGDTVEVIAANGDALGVGAWSPDSQIQVRLWDFSADTSIDADFFQQRIQSAINYRQQLDLPKHNTAYRLINAESDGLPGLVVDVMGEWLILQALTTGAERWKHQLAQLLFELIPCKGVYERSDVEVRRKEGLKKSVGVLQGETPPENIRIKEAGRHYLVDVLQGHKTGFYLDQRDNRSLLQHFAKDKQVLNCFSYTGGFGIAALQGGAHSVLNIDASQPALDLATQAAELNGFNAQQMQTLNGDVFKLLREYRDDGKQFDLIVLDPPKFAENRNQINKAARGYKDINLLGFKLLRPGGLLFTFSCSGLIDSQLFQKVVADAAVDAGCEARILRKLDQASDHPTRLAFPEGYYLKGLLCQK